MRIVIGVCKFHHMNDEGTHFDKNDHHILQRLLKSTTLINLMNRGILRRLGGQPNPLYQMCLIVLDMIFLTINYYIV